MFREVGCSNLNDFCIMVLSLGSSPAEVAAFVESEGFALQPFLDQQISGRLLFELSCRDLVSMGLCHLLGDALRILGRAQLEIASYHPFLATVHVQEMCPVMVCEWLQQHGLDLFARMFLEQNVCGYGLLLLTAGDLFAMGLLADPDAMQVFFQQREALLQDSADADSKADVLPTLIDSLSGSTQDSGASLENNLGSTCVARDPVFSTHSNTIQSPTILHSAINTFAEFPHDNDGIMGAVPKSHSLASFSSAPTTPLPLFPSMAAESPLKRRRVQTSASSSPSLSSSFTPCGEGVPFSEVVQLGNLYNSMCGHATGTVMMVTWQNSVFPSQWNGKPNGKFGYHGCGLDPNNCWVRVSAYEDMAYRLHKFLSSIEAGFGFVAFSALCSAKTFRKEHDGALCFRIAPGCCMKHLGGRKQQPQSFFRTWQN